MKAADQFRLQELCERYADQKLTPEEMSALEAELRDSAESRAYFASTLHLRAELRLEDAWQAPAADSTTVVKPVWWRHVVTAAAAACVTAAVVWMFGGRDHSVATLVRARHCQWAGSSLPTVEGARLRPGMLDLIEGLAVLRFDSGAELVLEAPTTLEVIDAMNCKLRRGTLVAEVPPQAKGFSVGTQEAKVIDWGTKFGVSADDSGRYMVRVLEGLVEVDDKSKPQTQKLQKGQGVDHGWSQSQLHPSPGGEASEPSRWQPLTMTDDGSGWLGVTTAFGRGRDSYIQSKPGDTAAFGTHPFLRVKRSDGKAELNRKGYLAFDLSKFAARRIEDAELVLTIQPSELGFASFVPDSTFAVYGVTDETADDWKEEGLNWQHAPAHNPAQQERYLPDLTKARLLGRFEVAQGVSRGARRVRSRELLDFLNEDTNRVVTLIICRETNETADSGLVHAFATKENDARSAPMLRVKLAGE